MNTHQLLQTIRSFRYGAQSTPKHILTLSEFKTVFDERMSMYIAQRIDHVVPITANERIRASLNHIRDLSYAGKRIRPYMAYLGYTLSGGTDDIYNALVGIELFHIFALIHDDVIDESDERHTVSTVHAHYRSLVTTANADHVADAQAILIGDLVFAWSQDALLSHTTLSTVHDVRTIFNQMIDEVVVGQMIDVDLMSRDTTTEEELRAKNMFKTARYTFVNPLKIGSALAGAPGAHDPFYEAWGTALGLAYQIQDDVLDITGNSKITGKDTCKDVEDGQHTFITHYIHTHGTSEQKKTLQSFWKRPLSANDKKSLADFLEDAGALTAGKALITQYTQTAEDALAHYQMPTLIKHAFEAVITLLKIRNA